ncbi:DUF2164 domain-containing protein [Brevundimonas sp. NIBR11]|uniref:DUF2164 domain-containing protein n=1 Tax=Brevundimonas sp. NIBR11 TaxID=3015999 RepID=UPI0022F0E926|nr:DUF2164 domain-containing protein [Brevundimonas sp. NIBR11]WGM30906.1 hypothetical protein KKHFBJBL_01140 [Brevundimonas sp. NIBR11]
MKPIVFSKEEQADLIPRIKAFVRDELDTDIGDLQASMLLDFFTEKMGHAVYNRAVYDAQALIAAKADEMAEALYTLERKP